MQDWNLFPAGAYVALTVIFLTLTIQTSVRPNSAGSGLPWAGRRPEFLADIRACLREHTSGLKTMVSGYKKFGLNGLPWILPGTGFQTQVMLPIEHIKWVIDQPDDVLSHGQFHGERLGLRYFLPGFDFTSQMATVEALRLHLTRNLGKIQGDLMDELRRSVDEAFGMDEEEWKELNVYDAFNDVVFQMSGRVLFGPVLTHNRHFMAQLKRLATWFGAGTLIIGQLVPWQLKRVLGFLYALPTAYYRSVCTRYLWPFFVERFNNMKRKREDPSFDYTPPEDLITWMYRAAFEMKDDKITGAKGIVKRFVILMSGSIASSTAVFSGAVLDLLASDPQLNYYQLLREECDSAFQTEDDWTSSATLLKLHRVDSALRESLRRNPTLLRGHSRMVMPKEGVTLPNGQHIPQGWMIGFPIGAVHADPQYYDEPDLYNPFRFLPKENAPKAMMVTTSHTYLAFGHSKYSCPGRWFASHLMKSLFSYLLVHYDMEPLKERPLNLVMGDLLFPPPSTMIRVRRRVRAAAQ